MSIGLGLVIAALILVVAWQVDKRNAWGKFGKGVAWTIAVVALLLAAFVGYLWWENGKSDRENAALVKKIRAGEVNTYWGITLGMNATEVEYLKGKPTGDPVTLINSDDFAWEYGVQDAAAAPGSTGGGGYLVWFNKDKKVTSIQCYRDVVNSCEPLAGIDDYANEKKILERFGEPEPKATVHDGFKDFGYGPVLFVLSEDRIYLIAVGRPSVGGK